LESVNTCYFKDKVKLNNPHRGHNALSYFIGSAFFFFNEFYFLSPYLCILVIFKFFMNVLLLYL